MKPIPQLFALSLCVLLVSRSSLFADIEEERMAEFLAAYDAYDANAMCSSLDALVSEGGTNAVKMLLPLADVSLVDIYWKKRFPEKAGITVGQKYIVYEALEQMSIPLEINLDSLTNSLPHPWLAMKIARLGIQKHGECFTTSVIERAESFGGQWCKAEHLCIPQTTFATNAAWPVSVTLSQIQTGLTVSITNYLSSSLSIPGAPLSLSRNTIRVLTDEQRPQRHRDVGSAYDPTLDSRTEDWFLTIPAHEGATFSILWGEATNGIPADVWSQAWAVQWALYDDMHHLFLSNLVTLP